MFEAKTINGVPVTVRDRIEWLDCIATQGATLRLETRTGQDAWREIGGGLKGFAEAVDRQKAGYGADTAWKRAFDSARWKGDGQARKEASAASAEVFRALAMDRRQKADEYAATVLRVFDDCAGLRDAAHRRHATPKQAEAVEDAVRQVLDGADPHAVARGALPAVASSLEARNALVARVREASGVSVACDVPSCLEPFDTRSSRARDVMRDEKRRIEDAGRNDPASVIDLLDPDIAYSLARTVDMWAMLAGHACYGVADA